MFFRVHASLRSWQPLVAATVLVLAIPLTWVVVGNSPQWSTAGSFTERFFRVLNAGRVAGDASSYEYLLTEFTVIPRYLGLLLYPVGLNIDHDARIQTTFVSQAVLSGFAVLAALLALAVALRRRLPLVSFGIFWMFVGLSVESSVIPISDPMVEHRMYLPMAGAALIFASLLTQAARWWTPLGWIPGTAVAGLFVSLTEARIQVWQDPLTLWFDALSKSPEKARVNANVAVELGRINRFDEAMPYICKAVHLDPTSAVIARNHHALLEQRMNQILESEEGMEDLEFSTDESGNILVAPKDPCGP